MLKDELIKNNLCSEIEIEKANKRNKKVQNGGTKGITLVALVVTIVVLLILAGITIATLFGENGIIKKAQDAADATKNAQEQTMQGLQNLANELANALGENGGSSGGDTPVVPEAPKGPNGNPLLSTVTDTNHENVKVEDTHGNILTVPKGFKVVEGTAGEEITVQNGVVIEDSVGNQFVWIPVGEVTLNDGTTKKEIILGRYTFASSSATIPGGPTLKQAAYTTENPTNYTQEVTISSYYKEFATRTNNPDGIASSGADGLNAIAKDLAGFVESVKTNGGYYLARYEASYGNGYNESGSDDTAKYENAKPLSKLSTANSTSSMNYTEGTLWNYITQLNASKVCKNMYKENKDINGNSVGVESDLVNSYAWDTAIVYIQEMGHTNFANKSRDNVGGIKTLANTGSNSRDKFCNIYDMVANMQEWSTEYSSHTVNSYGRTCVVRGGRYSYEFSYTNTRGDATALVSGNGGYRLSPTLLCKVKKRFL